MTCGLTRATFNRSALVRLLSETLSVVPDPKYDFGERLGQWLDFSDTLTLFSALDNKEAGNDTSVHPTHAGLPAQLASVRHKLSNAILHDGIFSTTPAGIPARIPFPTPLPDASPESAADFSPYHRYYLAHQRDMNAAITTLRATARKALAKHSAAGKQLADLDAAFEKFLITRERNLLANIPILLGQRFDQHYAEHRATLDKHCADDPATWTQPGSWLEAFCHDVQTALISELELRLKPVAGLIAGLTAMPGSTTESSSQ